MELKEGMYIRSKDKRGNQFVRRIVELSTVPIYGSIVVDKDIHNVKWVSKKNVLKASNSIIELVEVGDYVNGERVQFITNKGQLLSDGGYDILEKYNDISSIVTKEQFESMKYGVE